MKTSVSLLLLAGTALATSQIKFTTAANTVAISYDGNDLTVPGYARSSELALLATKVGNIETDITDIKATLTANGLSVSTNHASGISTNVADIAALALEKGQKGHSGASVTGAKGEAGTDGKHGSKGAAGTDGAKGDTGAKGAAATPTGCLVSANRLYCTSPETGGQVDVVLRFDASVPHAQMFSQFAPSGSLADTGPVTTTTSTFARPAARGTFTEVGIGCFDSNGDIIAGSVKWQDAATWNALPFITGDWAGDNLGALGQQDNTFGVSGAETLMWATKTDWREIGFVDTMDTAQYPSGSSTSTDCQGGYCIWNTRAKCNDADVSTSNQLGLFVK